MKNILIGYWILTTIIGVYWMVKNPSVRHGDDMTHFTLFDVVGSIFPCAIVGWVFVPMMALASIKFKR
jgi:hypothetical protein